MTHLIMGTASPALLAAASSYPYGSPSWIRIAATAMTDPTPNPPARDGTLPAIVYPMMPPKVDRPASWVSAMFHCYGCM